ncbi:MAG TPA: S41 family peptidase [Blastocatellia bacterium]|nr:S41 family peptidase [Blastocatellia bacterium]
MWRKLSHARLPFCLLLCWLACFFPNAAYPQQSQAAPTPSESFPALVREDKLRLFDQVWRAINDNYYDRNFNGVDWRIQRDNYRRQAESAASSTELYHVLRQMIGKLGDAHTRIYSPDDGFDRFRPSGTTVGVVVRRVESKAVVSWVDPNSDAYRLGIRPGFTVSEVNGQPVEKALEQIRAEFVDSSTPVALELQSFDRLFSGPRDTTVAVTFIDSDGESKPITLTRRFVEFQRRVMARQMPYHMGYIELTGFGPEIEKEFDYAMQYMQDTRGLILDLRNNGGGFVTTVAQVASYFFDDETDLGEFITRQGRSTRRHTQKLRTVYREPLIVLVSSRSASGSEIFAAAMQERKRALILGTGSTTCGCLLGVSRTLRLFDGGKLNISDTDFRTSQGRRIEGIGIKPDFMIDLRSADLLAGRDRALESAVDQLGRSIAFGLRSGEMDFKVMVPDFGIRASSSSIPISQYQR